MSQLSLFSCTVSSSREIVQTNANNGMDRWLKATNAIDVNHPIVRSTEVKITMGIENQRDKAIAIHNWVRENIKFGFSRKFWKTTASETITEGIGFCNPQGTVFVALLRASGIPARLYFVELDQAILFGYLRTNAAYVDHAYSEVFLDGKWIKTDSYIVDSKLFLHAQAKLQAEKRNIGYGTRRNATNKWDGISDSFSQYSPGFTKSEFGIYDDVFDFYSQVNKSNNGSWLIRQIVRFTSHDANERIDRVRNNAKGKVQK